MESAWQDSMTNQPGYNQHPLSGLGSASDVAGCLTRGDTGGSENVMYLDHTNLGGVGRGSSSALRFHIANKANWWSNPSPNGTNVAYLAGPSNAKPENRPLLVVNWYVPAPAPTQVGPVYGGHVNTLTPLVQVASESDPDGDPTVYYRYTVSAYANGSYPLWATGWGSSASATVPSSAGLTWNGTYYWQACAWDGSDPSGTTASPYGGTCSAWSPFRTATTYVAMGDSYASGEGNPPFTESADTCHRTNLAYGPLYNQQVISVEGIDFRFWACSGATTDKVTGTAQFPSQPPQISFVDASTRMITLQVGGDNVNFANVLTYCILLGCSPAGSLYSSDIRNLGTNISNLRGSLVQTYQSLVTATANMANIYILNYPNVIPPNPDFLQSTLASAPGVCEQAFPFTWDAGDIAFLAPYERQLNAVVQQAANSVGVHLIDTNASGAVYSFLNHDVCQQPIVGSGSWFNSLVNTSPTQFSFHPNATGQQNMELALVSTSASPATSMVSRAAPTPLTTSQIADLGALPTSGPNLSIDEVGLGSIGSAQTMSGTGFAPGTSVQVSALAPGDLGTVTTNGSGMASAVINSLAGLPQTPAAIVLRGTTPSGDSRIVFAPTQSGLDVLSRRG